jgi:anti-sigma factor RsiW
MSLTSKHIPFARLADMVEDRLSTEEAREARAHVAACARCAEQTAELVRVAALMRADASEDAPRDVLMNAIQLFGARPVAEARPGILRRIVAALTFDSSSLTPAFGVRSGQTAPARQLLFSAGDLDVDLRLAQGSDGWTVSGQVLGPCDGGQIELNATGEVEQRSLKATLNDLCEFTLPPVPEGVYALRLRLKETEVEISELSLRA